MPTPGKPKLASKLKNSKRQLDVPIWTGPEDPGPNGGISFSLLSRFLVCRQRFALLVLKGLKAKEGFNHLIEYGNMWHICEECLSGTNPFDPRGVKPHSAEWEPALMVYCNKLRLRYPMDREKIDHWHSLCIAQFPMYVGFWRDHPELQKRTPIEQERVFHVAHKLPSGREVWLKGKRDALDLIDGGVYIQENKTKSDIDKVKIKRQLTFDLQTMMYMLSLYDEPSCDLPREGYYRHGGGLSKNGVVKEASKVPVGEYRIKGVRYNVIKRSAHKSPETMLKKITEDIANNRGEEWFAKWTTDISTADVKNFCSESLDPILENLCNWWDVKVGNPWTGLHQDATVANLHWRHPYGVYNPLDEGRATDLDEYLATGSMVGLEVATSLFPELSSAA